jgi:hypothetical protein
LIRHPQHHRDGAAKRADCPLWYKTPHQKVQNKAPEKHGFWDKIAGLVQNGR